MTYASMNRDEPSRHGSRGRGAATSGERPPPNRQKTGSNLVEIQGPRRTWGANPPPSASTPRTTSDIGPGPTRSVTSGSGWGDLTPSAPVHEAVTTTHDAAASRGETQSSLYGWGDPAPAAAAVGWGEPESSTSAGEGAKLPTKPEHPPPPPTEPAKHHNSPPSPDYLAPGVHNISSPQSPWRPTPSITLKESGTADSKVTRKKYLDNLAKLTNASREHSEVTRKLEMWHRLVTGFSQFDMGGYVPEDKDTVQGLKLKANATVSKLVDAQLWPVGPPEIAQHTTREDTSQRVQDIRGRLQTLEDAFKSFKDQAPSLPADESPLMEHDRNVTPEVNGDTSLLSRLERLETYVRDAGSEVLPLCDGLVQTVENRIEQKLVALRIHSSALEEGELRDDLDPDLAPILGNVQGKVDKLGDNFSSLERQKCHLVDMRDTLVMEISKISAENDVLRSRNSQLDSTHEALKSNISQVDDNIQRLISEIKSSKMGTPCSHPATGVPQQMRRDIVEDILHDLDPAFHSLHHDFNSAMALGRDESLQHIMEKLRLSLEMVEFVYGIIEQSSTSK